MEPYRNLAGNSGVLAYEAGADYIKIVFQDGGVFLYDYGRPGPETTETLKRLAQEGRGLSTFISQTVQHNYSERLG